MLNNVGPLQGAFHLESRPSGRAYPSILRRTSAEEAAKAPCLGPLSNCSCRIYYLLISLLTSKKTSNVSQASSTEARRPIHSVCKKARHDQKPMSASSTIGHATCGRRISHTSGMSSLCTPPHGSASLSFWEPCSEAARPGLCPCSGGSFALSVWPLVPACYGLAQRILRSRPCLRLY